jgi:hypothetical protein
MRDEITGMRTRITCVRTEITRMRTEITRMRSEITRMRSEITRMRSEITHERREIRRISGVFGRREEKIGNRPRRSSGRPTRDPYVVSGRREWVAAGGRIQSVSRKETRMTTKKKSQTQSTSETSSSVGVVPAIENAASALPLTTPLSSADRTYRRNLVRRAPSTLITAVAGMAAQTGNVIAGVSFDPVATRTDQANADRLSQGASAAKAMSRRLSDDGLILRSDIAARALAVVGALDVQSRVPGDKEAAAKLAVLHGATQRRSKRKPAAPAPPAAPVAAPGATQVLTKQ